MFTKMFSIHTFQNILLFCLLIIVTTPSFANAASGDIQGYIVTISLFIKIILLPFLFGIAFLFFIFNTVRYFIIESASEDGRAKAKRSALYGIAAFVFLFTLWGLVTILVQGIGIEGKGENESLCPDYLKNSFGNSVCNNPQSNTGSGSTFTPTTFTGSGNNTNTSGGGSVNTYSGSTNSSGSGSTNTSIGTSIGSNTSQFSGLAEIIFGTGKDNASFVDYPGTPRAVFQVPTISETATCIDGMQTLLLANRTEPTQAAYVLYKNTAGAFRWKNITDLNAKNNITYDKDSLEEILGTNATNISIIHTHPKIRSQDFDLIMDGHGPSAADMRAMCTFDNPAYTYVTVDWGGIWATTQQTDTCPYNATAVNTLPIIETYQALAMLDSSTRQRELQKYNTVTITPSQYKQFFSTIDMDILSNSTPEEILSLSYSYQTTASTSIAHYTTAADFCSGL